MDFSKAQEHLSRILKSRFTRDAAERGRVAARKLLSEIEGGIEKVRIPVDLHRIAEYLKAKICFLDFSSLKSEGLGTEGLTFYLKNMSKIFGKKIVNEMVSVLGTCEYVVIIKHNLDEKRKRYVIAHEIGHIYLNHFEVGRKFYRYAEYVISYSEDTGLAVNRLIRKKRKMITWQEISSNAFAGELLVPTPVLKNVIISEGIRDLNKLADLFDVSQTVMYIQLGLAGCLDIIQ